jgi:hypothetical protein
VAGDRIARKARNGIGGWVAQHGLAAVSLVGALLYGTARLSYVAYYGEFGLDPGDVGIGYAATLARAVPGLLVVFGFVVLVFGGAIFGLALLFSRAAGEPVGLADLWHAKTRAIVLYVSVGVAFLLLVLMPDNAREHARDVERGEELGAGGHAVSRATYDNPLGLTARAVEVHWLDPELAKAVDLGDRVMLLGSSGDTHYLHDVARGRTHRIPTGFVVLSEAEETGGER